VAKHVCKILNIFLLLNRFLHLSLNEDLLLLNFLSYFFHLVPCFWGILGFKSEQYFCTLDFCVFNLWWPPWVFFIRLFALFKYNFWSLIQLLQNCWELLRKELSGHLWPLLLYLVSICPPKSIVATLLNRFLRLSLNENLLLSNFLSYLFPLVPCFGEF